MKEGLLIKEVRPGSFADALSLKPGERILAVNGENVRDFLDWNFSAAQETLTLEILSSGGAHKIKCSPPVSPEWGLTFEEPRFRHCGNRCIFCFVDQLPPQARKSLCFKDEDFRLSFWHGNYITLTNLREADFERIFRQRLSPLYISVHATDDNVRRFLLGNPKAPAILPLLKRLIAGKIALHTQVVICPGINDGRVLEQTLRDLSILAHGILSLAVIPVGLTKFRRSLYPLKRVTPRQAGKILKQLTPWQKKFRRETGSTWVYASDEVYLLAGQPIPPASFYGDYPQKENGVGLLRSFWEEFKSAKKMVEATPRGCPAKGQARGPAPTGKIALITGELFAPYLQKAVDSLLGKRNRFQIVAVKNYYLGPKVTVTGLLAGRDILETLSRGVLQYAPAKIIIPSITLKSGEDIFLDDFTLNELKDRLGKPVEVIPSTGEALMKALCTGQ